MTFASRDPSAANRSEAELLATADGALRNLLGIEKDESFTVGRGLTSLSAPVLAAAGERPEVAAAQRLLDTERMTPIEALVVLEELRRLADEEGP